MVEVIPTKYNDHFTNNFFTINVLNVSLANLSTPKMKYTIDCEGYRVLYRNVWFISLKDKALFKRASWKFCLWKFEENWFNRFQDYKEHTYIQKLGFIDILGGAVLLVFNA